MNLRRYNEILFAVLVTAAAVVFVVHLLRFGLHGHHEERAGVPGAPSPPGRSLAPAGAERSPAPSFRGSNYPSSTTTHRKPYRPRIPRPTRSICGPYRT